MPDSTAPAAEPSTHPALPPATGRRVLVNTGALTSASLWRIAMSFILQLLIARRLGVEALGIYTTAMAYLNVSQVFTELGLPALLVRDLAQEPAHRRSYFRRMLVIQVSAALLTWGALVLLTGILPYSSATVGALWLVGASLPLFAISSACHTLFQAGERMELVFGVEALINALILAASIGLMWQGYDVVALIGLIVATQLVSVLASLALLARSGLLAPPQQPAPATLPRLLRRATPFLGLSVGDVLLQRLDILLLSVVAGPTVVGVYSAAYNLVRVAFKLVQSFWRALYPTLSRLHRQAPENYARLARLGLRYTLLALLPLAAVGAGVADGLLHLIYGPDYLVSAVVLQISIWTIPLFLLEIYAITLLMVEHELRLALWITGVHLAVTLLLLPPLTLLLGAAGAALAVLTAGGAGAGLGCLLLWRARLPLRVDRGWLVLAASAVAGVVTVLLPAPWVVQAVAGLTVYVALIWVTGVLSPRDFRALRQIIAGNTAQ
jgi:O-antigen/teichoic acid export membrane protein